MELFLLFLFALPFFILILLTHRTNPKVLPPGPPGLPLIGHLHMLMFNNTHLHVFFYKLSQKYGPIIFLRLGSKSTIVVSSAKMAEEIMKTHDLDFCSRPSTLCSRMLSYNSSDVAVSPYNPYWREVRKLCVVYLFNSNRALSYRPIREDEVGRLIAKISKSSAFLQPVNLSEAMMHLSSTIVCRVGFGKRYEEGGAERSNFQGLCNEFQAVFTTFCVSDYFPSLSWVDKLSGFTTRLDKCFRGWDEFYQQIIDEHLDPNRPKAEQEDIVDVLLKIRKSRDFAIELTIDNIKAILMNVYIGGTETTASIVVWVMTFLMKNSRCMRKAQDEIRSLIGKREFINEEDTKDLVYLKAVIKETFRIQSIVPLLLPRESLRKCKIGDYEIPEKTMVYVNAWAVGRDLEVWENPEKFYPERFIDRSIDFKGVNFELVPFGAGRRICPGIPLAVAAIELILANLLYKFDWEMPPGMNENDLDLDALPGITIHKKNDLCLLAKKIK